jgi:chaperonin GroES
LVDDNEVNQIVAVELLEALGLRVDVASSGEDAIEAVQSGNYALVLMDCQMPGMDGYEATREIRRRHPGRKLPIVAFTAHALAEERHKVLQSGMDDYLTNSMATNLKPLGDRVIVQPRAKEEMTRSGIVLPDTAGEKPQEGNVLAVGPGRVLDNGKRVEMEVKAGDTVLFAKYAGTEVKLDGEEYLVIREADLLAILNSNGASN